MKRQTLPTVAFALTLLALPAGGADWPQFRGPGGLGIAHDKGLPATWSATENVVWKTDLPGPGSSSPIVIGHKIFVTCYSGYGLPDNKGDDVQDLVRHLLCIDRASGKIIWKRDVPTAPGEHAYTGSYLPLHGYASSTPACDGERVYVFFGKSGVLAFDLEGKQLWQTSVGEKTHNWGSGTSPVLFKDLVIVNASVESNSLVALNKSDGKTAWTARGIASSWNTPVLVDVPGSPGRQELVVSTRGQVRAFDPATGKELWSCEGVQDYVCPSVVAHQGIVYVIGGRANEAKAIRAGGQGDVSDSHIVWKLSRGSNVTSPVYHAGHLYWTNDSRGIAYCVDAEKGTVVWEERLKPTPERIYASPTLADGKLYIMSRTRGAYVLAAEPQFKLLAHNTLGDSSVFNASPVVHNGQLLLRSDKALYCIGQKR
jgi:outer membrane protein assembly factor BamB